MPRDVVFASKKRHHPDGFLLGTSSPKRLLSISEAELDSSIDTATCSTIRPECTVNSALGSLWNLASAAITSDCSTSMCVGRSTMSMNVVSSKPPSSVYTHSHASLDAASYNTEVSHSARGSPVEARCNDIRMYRSATSTCEGAVSDSLKCDGTASESECSEVTYPHTSSVSFGEFEGVSFSGKTTHIILRREKGGLNPKWGMDEAWGKDVFGSDSMLPEKRFETNNLSHNTSGRRGFTFSSMTCESGSCATRDSFLEEIRPEQGLSHIHGSVYKESFGSFPNVHTEGSVGLRAQERTGGLEYFNSRGHSGPEVVLNSSFLNKGKLEEEKPEELGPSYVLSSGRLSLEEEARLGRRAPTIDHDFEEYFSALMLE